MKVMKFGGSTIKNPDMMKSVAHIIKEDPNEKAVIVSALHRQTNDIREFLAKVVKKNNEIQGFVGKILNKHQFMVKNSISNPKIRNSVLEKVKNLVLKLERLLYGVAYTEELTPRTRDLILSSAERLSAHINEGALLDIGVPARAYEADRIGVVTDGVFCNATADLHKCEQNLKKTLLPRISEGEVPVITGFFGCDSHGRTTTFGKNGSDYSAAVMSYALNAKCLELR
jgi:aspartate kinase